MPAIDRELKQARRIHAALVLHAPELLHDPTLKLVKLTEALAACDAAENEMRRLESGLRGARLMRQKANAACWVVAQRAAAAARAHSKHGRNSAVVRAMGYKTDREKAKPGPKRQRKKR